MNAGLQCPRDGAEMSLMDFERGKLHACVFCKGCFLPGDVSGEVPRIQAWFESRAHSKGVVEESEVACPEGHGPMRAVELHGHDLDACMHCHGFWFDADELKRLQKGGVAVTAAAAGGAAASTSTTEAVASVGDTLAVVAEVAGGVFALLDLL
ncbi:MAG: zf-TFIIB domain-containing protein [Burkholderiales bacterium]|nr:zf-TFIIB domain-containing protein [Burkholderiales bacterium]